MREQINDGGSKGGSWSSQEIIMKKERRRVLLLGCSVITEILLDNDAQIILCGQCLLKE